MTRPGVACQQSHVLHILENLVVVHCYIGNVGIRESRTTTTNASPRCTATIVNHHRMLSCLSKITEQGTARNTATGN